MRYHRHPSMSSAPHEPPLRTADLPAAGGAIGPDPEHFAVDEIPLYAASGVGPHWYVRVLKRDKTTRDLVRDVSRAAGVGERDVGHAGLKDRHAITTQWLSVPGTAPDPSTWKLPDGSEVLEATRHGNKLRPGHQRGNRFRIQLVGLDTAATERALAIVARLRTRGLTNYFGAQRFGIRGENVERALAWLRGGRRHRPSRFQENLLSSAVQSEVFNRYLTLRAAEGMDRLLDGEVARVHGKNAMFVAESGAAETSRLRTGEVHATGPMIGPKMLAASGRPRELELEATRAASVTEDDERALARRAPGTRRDLVVPLDALVATPIEGGLVLSFELPSGSYATEVVREITRRPWLTDAREEP